jgi:hypothetical protein
VVTSANLTITVQSVFDVEMAVGNVKTRKSPDFYQIIAGVIKGFEKLYL